MRALLLCALALLTSCINSPTNPGIEATGEAKQVWTRKFTPSARLRWFTVDLDGSSVIAVVVNSSNGLNAQRMNAANGEIIDDPLFNGAEAATISPDGRFVASAVKGVISIKRRSDSAVISSLKLIPRGLSEPHYFLAWNRPGDKVWIVATGIDYPGLYELPNVQDAAGVIRKTIDEIGNSADIYSELSALPATDNIAISSRSLFDPSSNYAYRSPYYQISWPLRDGSGWFLVDSDELSWTDLSGKAIRKTLPMYRQYVEGYNDYRHIAGSPSGTFVGVCAHTGSVDDSLEIRVIDTRTAEHVYPYEQVHLYPLTT